MHSSLQTTGDFLLTGTGNKGYLREKIHYAGKSCLRSKAAIASKPILGRLRVHLQRLPPLLYTW
jgi:hypothetical protein